MTRAVLLSAVLCLPGWAGEILPPTLPGSVEIEAPATVQPYTLVVARLKQPSTAKSVAWWVDSASTEVDWIKLSLDSIVWTAPPGKYKVRAVVLTTDGTLDQGRTVVDISGTTPGPGPNPEPQPDPQPDPTPTPDPLPDGRYKLAASARDWVKSVQRPAALRATDARALAGSFRAVASAIAAGALKDGNAILAETHRNNNGVLAGREPSAGVEALDAWKPWADSLAARLKALYDAKQLATPADYGAAWGEIATGLEAAQ